MRLMRRLLSAITLVSIGFVHGQDLDDEVTIVENLGSANLTKLVFESPYSWLVLVTASEGCPNCDAMLDMVDAASRMSKGLAKFGVIDVAIKSNAKAIGVQPNDPVPHLRLYQDPGKPNAYMKGEYYRDFRVFQGQQSSRAIKKFIFDQAVSDAPVVNVEKEIDQWASKDNSVVAFSAKSEPSALIAALSRLLKGRANVGQVSSFDPQEKADIAKTFGDLEHVPSLVVRGRDGKWNKLDQEALSKADLDTLVEFVGQHIELGDMTRPINDKNEEPSAANAKSTGPSSVPGLLSEMVELDDIHAAEMPAIIALRISGDEDTPEDWVKITSKAHGVRRGVVYCNVGEEGSENPIAKRTCPLSKEGTKGPWTYLVYEFEQNLTPNEPRERQSMSEVNTLSKAKSDAMASVPETVAILNEDMFQAFLQAAIQSKMVPVVLHGKSKDVPFMLHAVYAATRSLCMVGYWPNPSTSELGLMGIPDSMKLPVLSAIIAKPSEENPEQAEMMVSLYDKLQFGKFTFESIISFILQVALKANEEETRTWIDQRGATLGIKLSEDGEQGASREASSSSQKSFDDASTPLRKIESNNDWAEYCSDDQGQLLCVVALLDGNPLNKNLESQLAILQEARTTVLKLPTSSSRLRFMWIDATCQEKFTSALDIELSALPGLAIYHPKKKMSFKMLTSFAADNLEKFLISVAGGFGKAPTTHSQSPKVENIDCASLDSRAAVVEDPLDDDEDWLAEIRAEEALEKAAMKEALQKELDAIKQAKEQAAKEQQTKTTSKKKKKKKKSKKATSNKDEL